MDNKNKPTEELVCEIVYGVKEEKYRETLNALVELQVRGVKEHHIAKGITSILIDTNVGFYYAKKRVSFCGTCVDLVKGEITIYA